jgi:hypothetical protein
MVPWPIDMINAPALGLSVCKKISVAKKPFLA